MNWWQSLGFFAIGTACGAAILMAVIIRIFSKDM